ncbi:DUF3089 domain-containing protein [Maricurvus nonylphenolicus]|uniref:DUF3089 domain-containing protein n=1 Tax=Maricurvus nonylphenolicus TaxID=1008307 RepID=UPI0036F2BAFC
MNSKNKALVSILAASLICMALLGSIYNDQLSALYSITFEKPDDKFDPTLAARKPDYSNPANWAALPTKSDPADLIPQGIDDADIQGEAPVDAFFIHPTGYLSGASWTSPMDLDSATEENTQFMMAYQASAFNGCCDIYAPRYRQASIYSYFTGSDQLRDEVLAFAYVDVEAAFEYFLKHYNKGRPFIIASHSQGTHHALRLLQEKIDNTPLYDRMIAAYTLGATEIGVPSEWFADNTDISACRSATQLGCVIHWDAKLEGTGGVKRGVDNSLCTNPLTWKTNERKASAENHKGAVSITAPFNLSLGRDNSPTHINIDHLGDPLPNLTSAKCQDGTLHVTDQSTTGFNQATLGGSYHLYDYTLFYFDIRDNAKLRVHTYLEQQKMSSAKLN